MPNSLRRIIVIFMDFLSKQYSFVFRLNDAYKMSFERQINELYYGVKINRIFEIYSALLHAKFGFELI